MTWAKVTAYIVTVYIVEVYVLCLNFGAAGREKFDVQYIQVIFQLKKIKLLFVLKF